MGNADLRAQFGAARHELNVSTYQMCILLLFNTADSLTYAEIAEQTGVPSGDLKRNLQSLACVKGKNVLRKEPMGKDIEESDTFFFNDRFTCKLHKVKIGTVAAQKESEPEKLETRQRIEDDRKPQIEAAIVRIMKARRVLDHNTIISEVTKQLSSRFMPNPAVVKKRIESLIEREFLERGALLPCACWPAGLRLTLPAQTAPTARCTAMSPRRRYNLHNERRSGLFAEMSRTNIDASESLFTTPQRLRQGARRQGEQQHRRAWAG
jgi:hypothetical protein